MDFFQVVYESYANIGHTANAVSPWWFSRIKAQRSIHNEYLKTLNIICNLILTKTIMSLQIQRYWFFFSNWDLLYILVELAMCKKNLIPVQSNLFTYSQLIRMFFFHIGYNFLKVNLLFPVAEVAKKNHGLSSVMNIFHRSPALH